MNLLFNGFEGSNEKKKKNEQATEGRRSIMRHGETPFDKDGLLEIQQDSPCMYDGPMGTVECMWVNIWCKINWIVRFC